MSIPQHVNISTFSRLRHIIKKKEKNLQVADGPWWSRYLLLISHQLLLGCCMWFQDITHFLLCISKPVGPPPSLSLIHSRCAQRDIWFSVQRHMYTAVSGCLKQLALSVSATFNHAFVYVIKILFFKTTTLWTVLADQIFQPDVGLVFVVAHISSKCSWFNDMQLIQIMCKL